MEREYQYNDRKLVSSIVPNKDHFSWAEINCFFKPWAIIGSSYNNKYFEYILIYTSLYISYEIDEYFCENPNSQTKDLFFEFKPFFNKVIGPRLGLEIDKKCFSGIDNFIQIVMDELNNENRIIIPADIFNLYYFVDYKTRHQYHYFIIKGYDLSKNIFYILDSIHHDSGETPKYTDFAIPIPLMYDLCMGYYCDIDTKNIDLYLWTMKKVGLNEEAACCNIAKDLEILLNRQIINPSTFSVIELKPLYRSYTKGNSEILSYFEYIISKTNMKKVFYFYLLEFIKNYNSEDIIMFEIKNQVDSLIKYYDGYSKRIYHKVLAGRTIINQVDSVDKGQILLCSLINSLKIEIQKIANLLEKKEKTEAACGIVSSIINIKNANISIDSEEILITLSCFCIYNLWLTQNDAPQLKLNIALSSEFDIHVNTRVIAERSFEAGMLLEIENNERILFGYCGTEIDIHCPEWGDKCKIIEYPFCYNNATLRATSSGKGGLTFSCFNSSRKEWTTISTILLPEKVISIYLYSKTWDNVACKAIFKDVFYNGKKLL